MNHQSAPINATIALRDQHDYRAWYDQLQARCIAHKVWDQVNPDSAVAPMAEPIAPELPDISTFTPASSLAEGHVPARISDLSSSGQGAFKDDLEFYKLQMDKYKVRYAAYKTESANLQHIMALIQATVSQYLQRTCCPPDQSIKQWIANLQAEAGITQDYERKLARTRYRNALKPPRSVTSWDTWLTEYNQAITEAEVLRVPEVLQFREVAEDFYIAVEKIAPSWVASHQFQLQAQLHIQQAAQPPVQQPPVQQPAQLLTRRPDQARRDMIRSFRQNMIISHPITRGRSQKVALVIEESSYFTNEACQSEGDAQQSDQRSKRKNLKRSKPSSTGRSPGSAGAISGKLSSTGARSQSPGSARATPSKLSSTGARSQTPGSAGARKISLCPACDMRHSLQQCFYLNPEDAPEWWKPNQAIQRSVELRLDHDLDFQSLIRAQSRPRTRTPAIKQSQTPNLEELDQ